TPTPPMEELIRFVTLAQTGRFTLSDLCEQFGISRKTAYKHLERYAQGGFKALTPRSSRPRHSPLRTEERVRELILEERRQHRTWGPKKLPLRFVRTSDAPASVPQLSSFSFQLSAFPQS